VSTNLFQSAVAAFALASFAVGAVAQATGSAQDYPSKPIRLIIPFTPGGGTDFLSRVVAAKLSETLKWTVVVENKPGAGGNIGLDAAAKSAPDGYTIVMGQLDNLGIGPWLHASLPYDPIKSFTPIVLVADSPLVLVVAAQSSYMTVADVVAAAKANPGKLTLASAGNGTTGHLTGELFRTAAGIKIQHVPYKGSAPALADVLGGQVDMSMPSAPSALPLVKSGKLRAVAVTSAKRAAALPNVPTIAESGYKDVDVSVWYGLLAPAGTPQAIVTRLNAEINKALKASDVGDKIAEQGGNALGGTPEEFASLLKKDYAKWEPIVKASGAKVE
jgi:tripartite-type tricarboxylate transporter receptor subunit TctC